MSLITTIKSVPAPAFNQGERNPHDAVISHDGPLRRLVALFAVERRDIWLAIAFSLAISFLMLATPITVQALVNFVSFGGLMQPLIVLSILMFGFLALAGTIRILQTYLIELLQRRVFVRVVRDLADRLPRVEASCYDRQHGPEMVNRFFDIVTVQKVAAMLLLDGVALLLQGIVGLLILAFYHPILLAFDAVLIAVLGFIVTVLGRGATRTSINESKAKYAVAASLEEIARHPNAFKFAGAAAFAHQRADALTADYVRCRSGHFTIVLRQLIGFIALQVLAATALLSIGGWLVMEGQLTLGQLVAAELIVTSILANFTKFAKQLENIYDLLAASDKLGHLMDLPLERADGHSLERRPTSVSVAMRDVSFEFENGRQVLDRFNLTIEAGERICIVGSHGSGKTVLCDLIVGLRTPTAGRIEMNEYDLREINLASIREAIAVVRDIAAVEATIEENVRMGRQDISHDDVRRALEEVGLLDEIRALPDGLATHLSSNGAPLSGGQALRLMVARAIIGKPGMIILDDSLENLDSHAQSQVLSAVLAPQREWTILILGLSPIEHPAISKLIKVLPTQKGQSKGPFPLLAQAINE